MDTFESREYNKQCASEQAACEKEVAKGIILNGKATGQKGAQSYPTDGEPRMLACPGVNSEDEEKDIQKGYQNT